MELEQHQYEAIRDHLMDYNRYLNQIRELLVDIRALLTDLQGPEEVEGPPSEGDGPTISHSVQVRPDTSSLSPEAREAIRIAQEMGREWHVDGDRVFVDQHVMDEIVRRKQGDKYA